MTDYNHWAGVGRLTRDAELKYTGSGEAVLKFSIASSSRVKRDESWIEEPTYREVTIWGKRGEAIAQYLLKGKQVAVGGQEREERWEHDGKQYHKLTVMASDIQLLGGKNESATPPNTADQPAPQTPANADDFSDDMPF